MRTLRFLLLSLPFLSPGLLAQESPGLSAAEDVSPEISAYPGLFLDEPEAQFFRILRYTHVDETPFTFDEMVNMATVIGRGNIVDVLPGRIVNNTRREGMRISTILLKIQARSVEKGDYEDFFFVEYVLDWSNVARLKETLYTGEVLFLLRPASDFYHASMVDASTSDEAVLALGDEPRYSLTLVCGLFVTTKSGQLASAIDLSQDFGDLYVRFRTLGELNSHIDEILSASR